MAPGSGDWLVRYLALLCRGGKRTCIGLISPSTGIFSRASAVDRKWLGGRSISGYLLYMGGILLEQVFSEGLFDDSFLPSRGGPSIKGAQAPPPLSTLPPAAVVCVPGVLEAAGRRSGEWPPRPWMDESVHGRGGHLLLMRPAPFGMPGMWITAVGVFF